MQLVLNTGQVIELERLNVDEDTEVWLGVDEQNHGWWLECISSWMSGEESLAVASMTSSSL